MDRKLRASAWIGWVGCVVLVGCFGTETTNPEPVSDVWLEFERASPEGPTRFRWYVGAGADYTSIVASGPTRDGDGDPCDPATEPCLGLPPGGLAAGPRLVGSVSAADLQRLRGLLDDPALRNAYAVDALPLGTLDPEAVGVVYVAVAATDGTPPASWEFAEAANHGSETTELLTALTELHRRYHAAGSFADESDRVRASERDWPVP